MTYYQDNHIRIYNKDCRSMDELPDGSVQMVCTSPPYWGLRRYSGEQDLIWGGDKDCEHQWDVPTSAILGFNTLFRPEGETSTPLGLPSDKGKYAETVKGGADRQQKKVVGNFCSLCGAWRGGLGLEPTIELYLQHLIEIMREIKRVLRKDGVFFLNIGDSYMSHAGDRAKVGGFQANPDKSRLEAESSMAMKKQTTNILKDKDLCLIPFRVAIAAQEDGWWVRSVIIWDKNNPMPESVNGWRWERHRILVWPDGKLYKPIKGVPRPKEVEGQDCPGCQKCKENDGYVLIKGSWRPTESHEFILMLTKSDNYYCDKEAVKEEYTEPLNRWGGDSKKLTDHLKDDSPYTSAHRERDMRPDPSGRNLRSVWSFPTVPFPSFKIEGKKLDHFAVFPEKLPQLCIKAATPEVGCCSKCGAPWARITESNAIKRTRLVGIGQDSKEGTAGRAGETETKTLGWQPTCKCNAPRVPSLVLDPMMGAGTTLLVAKNLNRYAVGYELSQEYCQLAGERCRQQVLL